MNAPILPTEKDTTMAAAATAAMLHEQQQQQTNEQEECSMRCLGEKKWDGDKSNAKWR